MATVEVLPVAPPPPYSRVASHTSLQERSNKRASDVGIDDLRPSTIPADALTGPLELVFDLPESAVLQHVDPSLRPHISGRIEEIARISAEEDSVYSVTEKLSALGKEPELADDDEPSSPPPLNPPSLPSFGMGLKRQKSFGCPATHLTDAEVKVQRELHQRCAAALSRLAGRFRLGGALSMARSRSGSRCESGSSVGVRESLS